MTEIKDYRPSFLRERFKIEPSTQLEKTSFGVDKIAQYGWKLTSEQGTFVQIPKQELKINHEIYQREGILAKIIEIAGAWSWIACGALIVAHRNGEYWVADGQHRKLAADRRSDITLLPCMVFEVVDVAAEAKAFLVANINRKPVSAMAKFKAETATGNETALFVRDVITEARLKFASKPHGMGEFKSIAMAMKLAAADPDGFRDVMLFASELAHASHSPVQERLVSGLHYLHTHIEGGITQPRLRARLKQIGPYDLVIAANKAASFYARGGARVWALGMLEAVNYNLRNKFALTGQSESE
jgi:hypothetical protein